MPPVPMNTINLPVLDQTVTQLNLLAAQTIYIKELADAIKSLASPLYCIFMAQVVKLLIVDLMGAGKEHKTRFAAILDSKNVESVDKAEAMDRHREIA